MRRLVALSALAVVACSRPASPEAPRESPSSAAPATETRTAVALEEQGPLEGVQQAEVAAQIRDANQTQKTGIDPEWISGDCKGACPVGSLMTRRYDGGFEKGEKSGVWTTYKPDGSVAKTERFQDGKVVSPQSRMIDQLFGDETAVLGVAPLLATDYHHESDGTA